MTPASCSSTMQTLQDVIASLFLQPDVIRLAILLVIVAAAGWMMRDFRGIVTATILSLLVFAAASYAEGVATAGNNAGTYAMGGVNRLLAMNTVSIAAYAACFAAMIVCFHSLRAVLRQ
jgi:hypothetical protein